MSESFRERIATAAAQRATGALRPSRSPRVPKEPGARGPEGSTLPHPPLAAGEHPCGELPSPGEAPLARIERQLGALVAFVADLAQILRNRVAGGASGCPVCAPVNAESPSPAAAAEATPAPTPLPPPRLLSVPQVAALLGIDPKTVRRWREAGVLPPPIQLGGIIRWRAEDLDAFLAERAQERRGA